MEDKCADCTLTFYLILPLLLSANCLSITPLDQQAVLSRWKWRKKGANERGQTTDLNTHLWCAAKTKSLDFYQEWDTSVKALQQIHTNELQKLDTSSRHWMFLRAFTCKRLLINTISCNLLDLKPFISWCIRTIILQCQFISLRARDSAEHSAGPLSFA